MKNLVIISTFLALLSLVACKKSEQQNSFAVVIDQESYNNAQTEVDDYLASIREDNLIPVLVIDKWQHPDSIRAELIKLYNTDKHPIEGAVFIGDIPVPMMRDAQHLSTAFKMDADRFSYDRSSIPSDRFYDDFDLDCEFLKQDTTYTNYFYYSLSPSSTQRLSPEIYTGRIKPFNNAKKYEQLRAYLKKAVKAKKNPTDVDQLLFFGGHGYISESMVARMDEKISLYDQFPQLDKQKNGITYLDHSMEVHVKDKLMSELQREDLDVAILHHHGADDTQYLSGMPKVDGVTQQIDGVKFYLRSKLRAAKDRNKDVKETIKYYCNQLGVPAEWFEGTFDKEQELKDSIYYANQDIITADVNSYTPNVRFIVLDACFTGSFHLDSCLASAYIFNSGNTVAVQANSVNALQDKWADEMIGLVGLGRRVGEWNKYVAYLETHIIGDPTFHFKNIEKINIQSNWTGKELMSKFDEVGADEQALILRLLFEKKYENLSAILLEKFKSSKYPTVRMECFRLLTAYNDDNFIECMELACDDSSEFIQRQAIYLISKSGDERLVPSLIRIAMRNITAARVEFNIKQGISVYKKEVLLNELDKIYDAENHFTKPDEVKEAIVNSIDYNTKRWSTVMDDLNNDSFTEKNKKASIRTLRNYNYHPDVKEYCDFVTSCDNNKLQVLMLEALGWFNISCHKDVILNLCNEILASDKYPENVKKEAERTQSRLNTRWYR